MFEYTTRPAEDATCIEVLNTMSADGWEYMHAQPKQGTGYTLFFKRRKPEASTMHMTAVPAEATKAFQDRVTELKGTKKPKP